ncbi:MAG: DUF1905 domain-containing protein [Phycisphaerae bacterium]|nr:DUF1905 domain-containing protein [Phycisphaerae bacterium]
MSKKSSTASSERRSAASAHAPIRFTATLHSPRKEPEAKPGASTPARSVGVRTRVGNWTFLTLPKEASRQLPSRGQVSIVGVLNGTAFQETLEPDGRGGHWLKVSDRLRSAAGAKPGDSVSLEVTPLTMEPEPKVPPDLRKALAAASAEVREAWEDITPAARRDFIHWIVSPKQAETRARRIVTACDMLAKGKRRPCCFDRSGMYSKSLVCPVPDTAGDAC